MKIATYSVRDRTSFGLVTDTGLVDLSRRLGVAGVRELLEAGRLHDAAVYQDAPADHALHEATLLPVVTNPVHCYCVGTNYADHLHEVQAAGVPRPTPKHPSLFIRYPETFVGHEQPLLLPQVSRKLDFEAELAVVIGRGGRYIAREDAMAHIAGYACFNDGSIRDWQFHSSQVTSGKNFMGTGAFGPWMVTTDEIADPHALDISLTINGEIFQSSNTRELIFDIPEIVAYCSAFLPLAPGDVIATGTPAGVGFSRKPPVFLAPGDICAVTIERVGTLRNPVAEASAQG